MAGRKNLDHMLSEGTAKPVIRRGQGIRLSTDVSPDELPLGAISSEAAPERSEPLEERTPVHKPESAQGQKIESAQSSKRTSAPSHTEPERVTRVSQGQRLRVDLVKQLKRIAVEEDRKLYEVMEEAIEQYIEQRKQAEH